MKRACVAAAFVLLSRAALADPGAHDRAVAITVQSMKHYERGELAKAVELLLQAYALEPSPTILYNLGRAYEAMGELGQAVDAYRRYVAANRAAFDRAGIERRIATLEAQLAERETLRREREAARRRASETPPRRPRAAPWVLVGVGVLGLGASGALWLAARARHDDARDASTGVAADEANRAAGRYATGATIGLVAGAALTVGGLAWGLADISVRGGPDRGAVISLRGRF